MKSVTRLKTSGSFKKGNKYAFKKGVSGNPSGRPINPLPGLIRTATKDGKLIIEKVMKLFKLTKSPKMTMWCAEYLRDTAYGKPVQAIRGVDEEGNDAPIGIVYER